MTPGRRAALPCRTSPKVGTRPRSCSCPGTEDGGAGDGRRGGRASAAGAPVWLDGQKTDGIDSALKDVRARVEVSDVIAKAHGKIFRFAVPSDGRFDDWAARPTAPAPGFAAMPGVFSSETVDKGSAALAAALPGDLHGVVADLGAGWGWLSAEILKRDGVRELHLIEADLTALDCARRNITDPRARFHWADATRFRPERRFDASW